MSGRDRFLPVEAPAETGSPQRAWLLTFTDLIFLLLAFFVLLFSMSVVDTDKWKAMTTSLSEELSPDPVVTGIIETTPLAEKQSGGVDEIQGIDLGYLGTLLKTQTEKNPTLRQGVISGLGERLAISLPGDLLFAPGEATLTDQARAALFELAGALAYVANRIVVLGHTDPVPVRGGLFASNWELSLARAAAVSDQLRGAGYDREIGVFGVADTRFGDLSAALPWVERMDLARRVDIIVDPNRGGS